MTLPKQITPCPINQAVVEIRFSSSLPLPDAIFGVVFSKLKDSYKDVERLPILQLPEAVRNHDPNLLFQPHYKLIKDYYVLQVGPKVISLSITEQQYTTWESYYAEIQEVFDKINEIGFISEVLRVGLRYVNFFIDDIWKDLNVSVIIIDEETQSDEIFIKTVLDKGNYKVNLQTGNQLKLEDETQFVGRASVIDIDTFVLGENIPFFSDMKEILWNAHNIEKEIFFGLLKKEFLNSFDEVKY